MSYDNLSIDYTTFEYVLYQMKYKMSNQPIESKTTYLNYYFKVRKVWLASEEQLIMIIQDNTEFKEKRKLFPNLLRFVKFIIVLK